MSVEIDLLASLALKTTSDSSGPRRNARFRASVITTFNAYLPFYEDVILRRLIAAGCQHNVLLMDADQWAEEMARPLARPRLAGTAYTLVPIRAPRAFHPKIGLLVGEKHARVAIGSHNVTLSGFGVNREITTTFDIVGVQDPGRHLAVSAWGFVQRWLSVQGDALPSEVLDAARMVAQRFAPWLERANSPEGDLQFIGSGPDGLSLWDQLGLESRAPATRVTALGAFFDREFRLLRHVQKVLRPDEFVIGIEPETVGLDGQAELPPDLTFVDSGSLGRGEGYVHAKALLVEFGAEDCVLVTGSPNLSGPAWLADPTARNAEAALVHSGESARQAAEDLGLFSLHQMPELSGDVWEAMRGRLSAELDSPEESPRPPTGLALPEDDGLAVHVTLRSGEVADSLRGFVGSAESPRFESGAVSVTDYGLFVPAEPDQLLGLTMVEILKGDSVIGRAMVHDPRSISRHLRTGAQQSFRDALDGLSGDSPDIASVVRFAEKLIFEEVRPGQDFVRRASKSSVESSGDEQADETIGSLIVESRARGPRNARRQVRSTDLGYLIDVLIHSLGRGLESQHGEARREGLSEEELIGGDQEDVVDLDRAEVLLEAVKLCQGKVRTLVRRMLGQLKKAHEGDGPPSRSLQQLLAVLSVLRELRRYDLRIKAEGVGESVVPLRERQTLVTETLAFLFERHRDLYREAIAEFGPDEDGDLSTLRGLLLWLAWDAGLDARFDDNQQGSESDQEEWLLGRARLVALVPIVVADESAWEVAHDSVLTTVASSPVEAAKANRWLGAHSRWGRAILKSFARVANWTTADEGVGRGMLAVAMRESPKRLRVVRSSATRSISLVDFGECRGRRARDFVPFALDSVVVEQLPEIA